jgi:RHS repeat-associated protein
VTYEFDSSGLLQSEEDRNSQGLSFAYTSGELTGITGSAGTVTLGYTSGLLTSVTLPDGRSVGYSYTSGLLTGVTDVRGHGITYGYDTSDRLNSITDQDGNTTSIDYGTDGRVSQVTDPRSETTTYSWDSGTQTETITDPRGKVWIDVYSGGALVDTSDPVTGDVTARTYDGSANVSSVTDTAAGSSNSYSTAIYLYDTNGNITEEDDPGPSGYTIKNWTYNGLNEPTSYTDGRSPRRTTRFEYDSAGNLTCVLLATVPSGTTTCAAAAQQYKSTYAYYSGTGQLHTATDPNGNTTTYAYDTAGDLTDVTGPPTDAAPSGSEVTMTYDSGGRMLTRVDPRGNVTGATPADFTWTYGYNDANQPTSVEDPLGDTVSYGYDDAGYRTSTTDADGNATRYEYDPNGNLSCVLYPDTSATTCAAATQAHKTTYGYDASDNLTSRTDGKGDTWTYGYDDADQLHTTTSPLSKVWTYDYFGDGALKKTTLPSGGTASYAYDPLGHLTGIDYSGTATPDVTFTYDANGNRTSMTDGGSGSVSYGYDDLNRLTSVTRGTDTFSYTYYPDGSLKEITYPDSSNRTNQYEADGTLCTITVGASPTACGTTGSSVLNFSYDPAENLTEESFPNGADTAFAYDDAGQLGSVTNTVSGSGLSTFTVNDRDPNGNPTSLTGPSGTTHYTYDTLNRLTGACNLANCAGSGLTGLEWTYDPVGNRLTQVSHGGSTTTTTYAYDADGQLCWTYPGTSSNACTSPPSGATTYSFNSNGDETGAGSWAYGYDLANRMISANDGSTTTSYAYDGDGNRLSATTGSTTTKYSWDTNTPLPRLALERDGSGTVLRQYTYDGLTPVREVAGSNPFYLQPDAYGSVAAVTSAAGATEWTYGYDPFGNATSTKVDSGAPDNPAQFNSQYLDPATGLLNLRARTMDPVTGRFLQQDPVPGSAASPYESNYLYVSGRPTVGADPSGLCWSFFCNLEDAGKGLINFGAGAVNFAVSTLTLGHIHVPQPFCGPGLTFSYSLGGITAGVETFLAGGLGGEAVAEGGTASETAGDAEVLSEDEGLAVCNCFPAGTKVATARGEVPIQEIKIGERVWAKSLKTGKRELRTVTGLFHKHTDELMTIDVGGARIVVTPLHPFWVPGRGWVESGDLSMGDRLLTRAGTQVSIARLREYRANTTVYNFSVGGDRDYFISRVQLLVHNCDIKSFSKHGIDQAISRGARPYEILDAVKNPQRVLPGWGDVTRYIGQWAEVRLNSLGRVVTIIRFKSPEAP